MDPNVFTVTQLVEAAEHDVRARSTPVQEKTAAASDQPQEFPIDLLSTESVMAMAKVARDLAGRMKLAEDAMEGSSGVNTGGTGAGKEDSLTPSAESPEQFVVAPKGEPDVSPSKNPLSIQNVTEQKPPSESMNSGASTPEQHLSPKVGGLDPIRSLHQLYARAAQSLAKTAQPGGYAQPVTETGPMAGPGKPEGSPTAPGTSGGDKPPTSYEAVRSTTRQDADAKALADATQKTDLPGAAAKETTEGVLNEVLKAASADQVKAAAFRQWYATLPSDSKIASLIRDKVASMGKKGQEKKTVDPQQPAQPPADWQMGDAPAPPPPGETAGGEGTAVQVALPGGPIPVTDPRLTGAGTYVETPINPDAPLIRRGEPTGESTPYGAPVWNMGDR